MDERELNRAIDAAAEQMMAREPSGTLSYSVMARVRADHAPSPRRFVWAAAGATVVLCAATAIVLTNRNAATIVTPPPAAQLRIGHPAVVADVPVPTVTEATPMRSAIPRARGARGVEPRVALPPNDVSPIEPIQTAPIVLAAIDVPQLERESTSIEVLSIEPLTIEPLAASND